MEICKLRGKGSVAKSIIQSEKKCYVTGATIGLHLHHCIYGSNRKNSDKYGLTVWLHHDFHTGRYGVHNGNNSLDLELKQLAQRKFEEIYGHERFVEVFGRNYI